MNRNKDLQINRWPRAAHQPPPKRAQLFPELHGASWSGEDDGHMTCCGVAVLPHAPACVHASKPDERGGDKDRNGADLLHAGSLLEAQLHVESLAQRAGIAQPQAAGEAVFERGDTVRCINAPGKLSDLQNGATYTVESVHADQKAINIRGTDGKLQIGWFANRFELVHRASDAPECPEARKAGLPRGWRVKTNNMPGFERCDQRGAIFGPTEDGWGPQTSVAVMDGSVFYGCISRAEEEIDLPTAAEAARYVDDQLAAKERAHG